MPLTKEEIKALLLFMQRVDLKGSEARIFTMLVDKLEKAYNNTGHGLEQHIKKGE